MLSSKKPLRSTKPLSGKTTLKAKKTLQKVSKSPTKQKKPMVSKLRKKADTIFSKAIRYRDGELRDGVWWSQCITCDEWQPLKKMQNGHFMSRRYNATRFSYENCNAQCYRDNVMFYGEQYKYAVAIDFKYGKGTADRLAKEAKVPHPFSVAELEDIIHTATEEVKFYESLSA